MESFKNFYKEGKTSIIVLTNKSEQKDNHLFITATRIKEECKKADIKCYMVFSEDAYIKLNKEKNQFKIYNVDDKEGFPLDRARTAVIARRSVSDSRYAMNLLSQLEDKVGLFVINSRDCIEICDDKYQTIIKLQDVNLPVPRTSLVNNEEGIDTAVEKVGGKFPLIMKTLHGSAGIGVFFVESHRSLKSILQVIWKLNPETEILVQEFIKNNFDYRVHVLGGEIIAAMKRYVIKDDFRSNYSLGGKVENVDIEKMDDSLKEICIRASKAVKGIWTGVDVIIDEKTEKPYFLEVNSSPGTEGIEKISKINVVGKVIEFINERKNWVKNPRICGYKETVTLIGEDDTKIKLLAKFDTGNSTRACAIRVDKCTIEGKKAIMWIDGKKIIGKYIGKEEMNIHGVKDWKTIERDFCIMTLNFIDDIYENVKCSIDVHTNKSKSAPLLMNKLTMSEMNVAINPFKKYLLTVEEEK